jgi:hypothetical protein
MSMIPVRQRPTTAVPELEVPRRWMKLACSISMGAEVREGCRLQKVNPRVCHISSYGSFFFYMYDAACARKKVEGGRSNTRNGRID